ncbi:DNA recombination protein RmuC, partial [Fluviicola sp.]|uniref:DNA recombination protein RmuC n=1 Tax=Fluviicola sp. TaxID=1917219 RepID=UPI0026395ECB
MKKLSAILSFFLLFACSFGSQAQESGMKKPKAISFDLEKMKQLDFGSGALDPDKILFKLFPAPMDEDDPETVEWRSAAFWSCRGCEKRVFKVLDDEPEEETIPYERNYTVACGAYEFKTEDGISRAIISFSTSDHNDGTGRFARGVLSVALFEKQNNQWKLINFNPFVNLQGSFTLASGVDGVFASKHKKVYFLIHGGQANGVSTEEYWPLYQGLYVIDPETLQEVFHLPSATCQENGEALGTVWESELIDIQSGKTETVFFVNSKGLIVKEHVWELPAAFNFVSEADFKLLPERFQFEASQMISVTGTGLVVKKTSISIHYKDEKGMAKMRGTFGEVQLGALLEQMMSPEQYDANVKTKKSGTEFVEFAIKLPGKDDSNSTVYLPIDAKFPKDIYEQYYDAFEAGDTALIESSGKQLEATIKKMAKDIHEKYVDPPYTTDFAIMFLPFESIYAEVIRRTSLVETLQREYKIVVTGPTTLGAILNSLQMGFRTLAIQKRTGEVWTILGAVKTEFGKFGGLLEKVQKNLQSAGDQLEEVMGKRTRAIERKL